MKITPAPTTDLKEALLNARGTKITFQGRTYKLDSYQIRDRHQIDRFYAYAENLTPHDATEAKFCIWDLWQSDGEDGAELLHKFATLGGYDRNK